MQLFSINIMSENKNFKETRVVIVTMTIRLYMIRHKAVRIDST